MGLQQFLAVTFLIAAAQGWEMHLRPSGERLQNRLVGENFLVVCSILDYDGPASAVQVNWIKDNEVIRAGGRVMTIEKPLSSQLMIVHARKEDSGDYMCQAKLNGETKHAVATISFIKAPQFVNPKKEQHPEEGTAAEIECKVDAEPGVEIFWQFNGLTLGETSIREYDFKDNKQILVIPHYDSKKDDGVYLCNAAQFSSFETLSINVSGHSRPLITVFDGPADNQGFEGQSTQFKCQAVGKPKPTYKWLKVADDEEIFNSDRYTVEDGLLIVNALTETDAGQYKCIASNDVGQSDRVADLKVFLKPKVQKMANEVKQGGEEVTFKCRYSGTGAMSAKFVFGEEEYKPGYRYPDSPEQSLVEDSEEEGDEEEKKEDSEESGDKSEEGDDIKSNEMKKKKDSGSDSGEDANGDRNSDSEENDSGSTNSKSDSGEDENGDGNSGSEETAVSGKKHSKESGSSQAHSTEEDENNSKTRNDDDSKQSDDTREKSSDSDSGEDADGDGNSDSEENKSGKGKSSSSDSGEDADGDGDSDSEEQDAKKNNNSGEDHNADGDSGSEEATTHGEDDDGTEEEKKPKASKPHLIDSNEVGDDWPLAESDEIYDEEESATEVTSEPLKSEDSSEEKVLPRAASKDHAAEEEEEEEDEDEEGEEVDHVDDSGKAEKEEKDEDVEEDKRWRRFLRDVSSQRIVVTEEGDTLLLTIRRLSTSDAGDYQCEVSNEAGITTRTVTLAITHAPTLTSWTEGKTRAHDGSTYTLHCDVTAVPEPKWRWFRGSHEIEADGSSVVIDNEANASRLTITATKSQHFGDFRCIADNGVGESAEHTMRVVRVVKPTTPPAPSCREHVYPNYGSCDFEDGTFDDNENADNRPAQVIFFYAPLDAVTGDFDWATQARNVTAPYSEDAMQVPGLETNSAYLVRALAVNEAGTSELSEQGTIETTDPWAPEQPLSVSVECDTTCKVTWNEPNNHGARINSYIVSIKEQSVDDDGERVYTGQDWEFAAASDDSTFEIPHLKPLAHYEVSVLAVNIIGRSEARSANFDTPDTLSSSLSLEQISSPGVLLIIIVALLLLFCLIDVTCYAMNRCGVLACFCANCLGRRPVDKKPACDIETGSRGESGRLLDGSSR